MRPSFARIMNEVVSPHPQMLNAHAAIRSVSVQKQRITQSQIEPVPIEICVLRRQCRQQSDQLRMIVMIPQHKVELAFGDSLHQLL
jgi:hypothetical protein